MSVLESPVEIAKKQAAIAPSWSVIVLNDPVNLMDYVVMVFRKVFGYDKDKATRLMLEVHQLGRSKVWTGEREKAEFYTQTLQKWQLTAILENES